MSTIHYYQRRLVLVEDRLGVNQTKAGYNQAERFESMNGVPINGDTTKGDYPAYSKSRYVYSGQNTSNIEQNLNPWAKRIWAYMSIYFEIMELKLASYLLSRNLPSAKIAIKAKVDELSDKAKRAYASQIITHTYLYVWTAA